MKEKKSFALLFADEPWWKRTTDVRQAAEQQLELRKSAAIYPAIPPSARGLSTRGPPDEPPNEPPDEPPDELPTKF